MTIQNIRNMLAETTLPVAYDFFKETTNPPFIAFVVSTSTLTADSKVIGKIHKVTVELYCETFNSNSQKSVESVLCKHNIIWESDNTYIDSERLFQITYDFESEEKV